MYRGQGRHRCGGDKLYVSDLVGGTAFETKKAKLDMERARSQNFLPHKKSTPLSLP
jgi:hypothetical protein